jgi:hypothetical protein
MTPKAFGVLAYLLAHQGRLVTKDELLGAVWPGSVVGDAALTVAISEIRRTQGDDARTPRFIETVHRRGFRLLAPLALRPLEAGAPVPRFVGRTAELARLERSFGEAAGGTRRVVVVTGEAGMGKTAWSTPSSSARALPAAGRSLAPSASSITGRPSHTSPSSKPSGVSLVRPGRAGGRAPRRSRADVARAHARPPWP